MRHGSLVEAMDTLGGMELEMRAENAVIVGSAWELLEHIVAVLPVCPACGGSGRRGVDGFEAVLGTRSDLICRDCGGDGKVSIERLAAVFNAVIALPIKVATASDEIAIAQCKGHNRLRDELQSIR